MLIIMIFPIYTSADGVSDLLFGSGPLAYPCAVPVYHMDLAFPPEGGLIVRTPDSQMYFVRTYLPGCNQIPADATIVSPVGSSDAFHGPAVASSSNTQALPTATATRPAGCTSY